MKTIDAFVDSTTVRGTAFVDALELTEPHDRTPLGADSSSLYQAWTECVHGAPRYRGWNSAATMQRYPSNIGGTRVLDDAISALFLLPPPPQGDPAWYDYALYLLGAVITAQAFTDGNKRMSRLAYVLTLLRGDVPIVVPNSTLGGSLGDMG